MLNDNEMKMRLWKATTPIVTNPLYMGVQGAVGTYEVVNPLPDPGLTAGDPDRPTGVYYATGEPGEGAGISSPSGNLSEDELAKMRMKSRNYVALPASTYAEPDQGEHDKDETIYDDAGDDVETEPESLYNTMAHTFPSDDAFIPKNELKRFPMLNNLDFINKDNTEKAREEIQTNEDKIFFLHKHSSLDFPSFVLTRHCPVQCVDRRKKKFDTFDYIIQSIGNKFQDNIRGPLQSSAIDAIASLLNTKAINGDIDCPVESIYKNTPCTTRFSAKSRSGKPSSYTWISKMLTRPPGAPGGEITRQTKARGPAEIPAAPPSEAGDRAEYVAVDASVVPAGMPLYAQVRVEPGAKADGNPEFVNIERGVDGAVGINEQLYASTVDYVTLENQAFDEGRVAHMAAGENRAFVSPGTEFANTSTKGLHDKPVYAVAKDDPEDLPQFEFPTETSIIPADALNPPQVVPKTMVPNPLDNVVLKELIKKKLPTNFTSRISDDNDGITIISPDNVEYEIRYNNHSGKDIFEYEDKIYKTFEGMWGIVEFQMKKDSKFIQTYGIKEKDGQWRSDKWHELGLMPLKKLKKKIKQIIVAINTYPALQFQQESKDGEGFNIQMGTDSMRITSAKDTWRTDLQVSGTLVSLMKQLCEATGQDACSSAGSSAGGRRRKRKSNKKGLHKKSRLRRKRKSNKKGLGKK
jgi:hypothetical protein